MGNGAKSLAVIALDSIASFNGIRHQWKLDMAAETAHCSILYA